MKSNREKLIETLIELSFDELETSDLIDRLIHVAKFFKEEYNS